MENIRTFTRDDIPSVADLFQKVFRHTDEPSPESLKSYVKEIYFGNPWYDESLPSFVYQTNEGKIVGFIGVMPFRMSLDGQGVQAAIGGNYMVDPAFNNPLAGVRILKKFFDGPQDLSMTDTSTEYARKLWTGLGGKTCVLNSMHWTRPLRPSRYAMKYLAGKKFLAPVEVLSRPFCSIFDSIIGKVPQSPMHLPPTEDTGSDLSVDTLLEGLNQISEDRSLRPVYDQKSLSWLVNMLGQKTEFGKLSKVAVRDNSNNLIGWYLYYPNPGNLAPVLQIAGKKDSIGRVWDHLLNHSWREGSLALEGRLESRSVKEYSYKFCMFYQGGRYIMMHTRKPEILRPVFSGDAFLTRLEGEWWTRFQGDQFQ